MLAALARERSATGAEVPEPADALDGSRTVLCRLCEVHDRLSSHERGQLW